MWSVEKIFSFRFFSSQKHTRMHAHTNTQTHKVLYYNTHGVSCPMSGCIFKISSVNTWKCYFLLVCAVKPALVVISVKQPPGFRGHYFVPCLAAWDGSDWAEISYGLSPVYQTVLSDTSSWVSEGVLTCGFLMLCHYPRKAAEVCNCKCVIYGIFSFFFVVVYEIRIHE